MRNDYGFSNPNWNAAKEEARSILIDVARQKARIAYSELAGQIRQSILMRMILECGTFLERSV
jgi:hypothetical protein